MYYIAMLVVWAVAFVGFLVLESFTMNIVAVWFAGGSLAALIMASADAPVWAQLLVFLIVSGLLLMALRPVARRWLSTKKVSTNSDRNVDKVGKVVESIDNNAGTGAVYIDGKTWTARSFSGLPICEKTLVRVMQIEGVKLIVQVEEEPDDSKCDEKLEVLNK